MNGSTKEGMTAIRQQVVVPNIKGYDIVFLQEVPWVKAGTKVRLADPAGYDLSINESGKRHSCILYNPKKLQWEDHDTTTVTELMKSVKGWGVDHSNQLCVQVFSLTAMGELSKFVAISLHAPRSNTKAFCEVVKTSIATVVAVHKLPVLVGGDFNMDVYRWRDDGFLGLHKSRYKRIDFIMMKVPERIHLKIVKVQILDIDIPEDVQTSKVMRSEGEMISVKDFKEHYTYDFYRDLCDSHMPLMAEIEYHMRKAMSEFVEKVVNSTQ